MSRASDYVEKYQDVCKMQPNTRYGKAIVHEYEHDPSFRAEITGKGLVVITQGDSTITTDCEGAMHLEDWILRTFQSR